MVLVYMISACFVASVAAVTALALGAPLSQLGLPYALSGALTLLGLPLIGTLTSRISKLVAREREPREPELRYLEYRPNESG